MSDRTVVATLAWCPHCRHPWDHHQPAHAPRCTACGCMWSEPRPPEPPKPPPDPRIEKVRAAIFAELERQHETGDAWMGLTAFYNDDVYSGFIEGEPDWRAVAKAAIAAVDAAFDGPPELWVDQVHDACGGAE